MEVESCKRQKSDTIENNSSRLENTSILNVTNEESSHTEPDSDDVFIRITEEGIEDNNTHGRERTPSEKSIILQFSKKTKSLERDKKKMKVGYVEILSLLWDIVNMRMILII